MIKMPRRLFAMPRIFFPSSKPRFVNKEEVVLSIKKLAIKVAKKNKNVKEIYLFGSFPKGDYGIYSDADILVVVKEDERRMIDRLDEYLLAFSDASVPVDVLVYTEEELSRAIESGSFFIRNILKGEKLVG
jgi:predicted nucleotidyltransferase